MKKKNFVSDLNTVYDELAKMNGVMEIFDSEDLSMESLEDMTYVANIVREDAKNIEDVFTRVVNL